MSSHQPKTPRPPLGAERKITMKKLHHIIDTWRIIEKYDIKEYICEDSYIAISEEDFQRVLDGAYARGGQDGLNYIKHLVVGGGKMLYSHNYLPSC